MKPAAPLRLIRFLWQSLLSFSKHNGCQVNAENRFNRKASARASAENEAIVTQSGIDSPEKRPTMTSTHARFPGLTWVSVRWFLFIAHRRRQPATVRLPSVTAVVPPREPWLWTMITTPRTVKTAPIKTPNARCQTEASGSQTWPQSRQSREAMTGNRVASGNSLFLARRVFKLWHEGHLCVEVIMPSNYLNIFCSR